MPWKKASWKDLSTGVARLETAISAPIKTSLAHNLTLCRVIATPPRAEPPCCCRMQPRAVKRGRGATINANSMDTLWNDASRAFVHKSGHVSRHYSVTECNRDFASLKKKKKKKRKKEKRGRRGATCRFGVGVITLVFQVTVERDFTQV